MKRFSVLLLSAAIGHFALGQENSPNKEIRVSIMNLFNSGMQIQYEKHMKNNHSFVGLGEVIYEEAAQEEIVGYSAEMQLRKYFGSFEREDNKHVTEQYYVAPTLRYNNKTWKSDPTEWDVTYFDRIERVGFAFIAGIKFIHSTSMVMDVNAGALMIKSFIDPEQHENNYQSGNFSEGYSGIRLTMSVSIGIQF